MRLKQRKEGANQPYTLTHVEMVEDSDIDRFAKLGISADFQVGHDFAEDPKQKLGKYVFYKSANETNYAVRANLENRCECIT